MDKCKLCLRDYHRDDVPISWMRVDESRLKFPWARDVCSWCFRDFMRTLKGRVDEDSFNSFVAKRLDLLAKRAAQGNSLMRCEALVMKKGDSFREDIPSHRCERYAKTVINGKHVCHIHKEKISTGRKMMYCEPSPAPVFIGGGSCEEVLFGLKKYVPKDWWSEISRSLAVDA